MKDLAAAGVRVFVPEITDYEVRRKLIHIGATAGIRRLDQVKATLDYAPITTDGMLLAADLWAMARSAGLPTAGTEALDGDCILAAQALVAAGSGDTVSQPITSPTCRDSRTLNCGKRLRPDQKDVDSLASHITSKYRS